MYGLKFKLGAIDFVLCSELGTFTNIVLDDPSKCPIEYPMKILEESADRVRFSINGEEYYIKSDHNMYYTSNLFTGEAGMASLLHVFSSHIQKNVPVMPLCDDTFRICHDGTCFKTRLAQDLYCAVDSYYWTSQELLADVCCDVLGYDKEKLREVFGLSPDGDWPYGTKEQQYGVLRCLAEAMNHYDRTYCRYDGKHLVINGRTFFVRENRDGKFYLTGNMESLYRLTHSCNRRGFLEFVTRAIGHERKFVGIFPELNEDEFVKTINAIMGLFVQ